MNWARQEAHLAPVPDWLCPYLHTRRDRDVREGDRGRRLGNRRASAFGKFENRSLGSRCRLAYARPPKMARDVIGGAPHAINGCDERAQREVFGVMCLLRTAVCIITGLSTID